MIILDTWVVVVLLVLLASIVIFFALMAYYASSEKRIRVFIILTLVFMFVFVGVGIFIWANSDWGEPTFVESVNLSSIDDNGKYLHQDGLSYVGYVKNGNDFDPVVMLVNNTRLTVDNNETPRADMFVSKFVSDLGFIGFCLSDNGVTEMKSAHVYIPEGGLY